MCCNVHSLKHSSLLALALLLCASPCVAAAGNLTVLHFFKRSDGIHPAAGPTADAEGNLYGTTETGGKSLGGTVYKLASDGKQTVLFSFCAADNCNAGSEPEGNLVLDESGTLYGTTAYGGPSADGLVFALTPKGSETVLHQFTGGRDGEEPESGLLRDGQGNLFGTTVLGGSHGCGDYGCGTVFEIAPDGSETVLYAFTGKPDGAWPYAGLVSDGNGNLYGTTSYGGANDDGAIFEITNSGSEKILHSFSGTSDGRSPVSGLYRDEAGNLFGTTDNGGQYGLGVVYELAPDGTTTVLHAFAGGHDGANPDGALIADAKGDLFGTTRAGGHHNGTIFEIAADGSERVLYAFRGRSDGKDPVGSLVMQAGTLFGATQSGGPHEKGEVFELVR